MATLSVAMRWRSASFSRSERTRFLTGIRRILLDLFDGWGDRLAGTAVLNYDMDAGELDVAFSGIRNIDRGTALGVEAVFFSDLAVGPDGTFARG